MDESKCLKETRLNLKSKIINLKYNYGNSN
jgi:hypothetical protein